jgi:DNA polymerase III delta prime subunit
MHNKPDLKALPRPLSSLLTSSRLSHLYIFTSPTLCRVNETAKQFLLSWLESSSPRHPDLLHVQITGKVGMHSLEYINGLLEQLSLSPHQGKGRAILLEAADRMLPATANALLKALEEPPTRSLIVLTTNALHRLLPTIVSRAQVIRFPGDVHPIKGLESLFTYYSENRETISYSTLKTICEDLQKALEKELAHEAKKDMEGILKEYKELSSVAKNEFQQQLDAGTVMALQLHSKEILEEVYVHYRSTKGAAKDVRLLLKALRGLEAGADLSSMLFWYLTNAMHT